MNKKLSLLFIGLFLFAILSVSAFPDSSTQSSGNLCQTKHTLSYNYNFEYDNNLELGKTYDLKILFSLRGSEVTTNPYKLNIKIIPLGFEVSESSFSMDSSKTIQITPINENPTLQVETTLVLDGDNPTHRGYKATYIDKFEFSNFIFSNSNSNSINSSSSTNIGEKNVTQTTIITDNTQIDINVGVEEPSKVPWYLVRLMGILAFIFLSLSVFISLSKKANYKFFPFIFKYHHDISIFAILFSFLHIINNLLDNYMWSLEIKNLFWFDFSSTTRIMISFGVISFYLMILVVITSLSPKIINFLKYKNWKYIHLFSYLLYIFVIIHSFFIGTDLDIFNLSGALNIIVSVVFLILILINIVSFIIFIIKYLKRKKE